MRQILGVIGQRHVRVALGLGGLGHVFEGLGAVGPVGVRVQVALDVAELDQLRQAARLGGFDLALVLAQLGRDPRQPQALVDARLVLALEDFAAGVVFEAERGQPPAALARQRFQARNVGARARVPDQRAAPRVARARRSAALRARRTAARSPRRRCDRAPGPGSAVRRPLPISSSASSERVGDAEQIEPADGVLHAADAADDRQPVRLVGSPSASRTWSKATKASESSPRVERCLSRSRLASRVWTAFGPNPGTSWSRPSRAAASSSFTVETPSSWYSARARPGPRPGTCSSDASATGKSRRAARTPPCDRWSGTR